MNKARTALTLQPRSKSKGRSVPLKLDLPLFGVIFFLSIFGILMIYSGSAIVAVKMGNPPYFYALRQAIWVIVGLVLGFIVFRIDYHTLAKFSFPMLVVSIGLLILVLFVDRNQAIKRWIDLGAFDLQPSEITKFTFLLYLSSWLAKHREKHEFNKTEVLHHLKYELLPFLLLLGVVCGLIVIEPDMDTTIMLGLTGFIVYFLAGSDALHLIGALTTAALSAIAAGITTLTASYRIERLKSWLDFWRTNTIANPYKSDYQFQQILVAVASGGWFGVGFGESKQKYLYLGNTAFSDTIFAIFAEEFGLIGGIILVALFIFILLRGFKVAMSAPDKLGFLIGISVTTWLCMQAFLHIAANVALIPINGNTLTFLSYGGSSTVVNLMAAGLLLNVARFANPDKKNREQELNSTTYRGHKRLLNG